MGTLYYCHGIVRVSATEDPVFHCSSLGRRRLLTPVLRVVLRIVTAPLHLVWAVGCPSSMLQAYIVESASWASIVS